MMCSQKSTPRLLPGQSERAHHKQMVDYADEGKARLEFVERLDYALAMHGLTNQDFARKVDPHSGQQLVTNWRRRGKIGNQSVAKVQGLLPNISVSWINTGAGPAGKMIAEPVNKFGDDAEVAEIPVWDARAAAGITSINEYGGGQAGSILFRPRSLAKQGIHQDSAHVFFVSGDSMAPRLNHGDAVLFDTSLTRVRDGKVYVIQWGEDTLVKRLYRELDGTFRISSDNKSNPEYRDRMVAPDADGFVILGQVRWVGSWES